MGRTNTDHEEGDNMVLARDFSDNDIYLLEVVSDKVVINDNYTGLIVLDSGLKTVRRHDIMDDFVVDGVYTKGSDMLLYCDENRLFVHIDVAAATCKAIPLPPGLYDTVFLTLCEWEGDRVSLEGENGELHVELNLSSEEITIAPNGAGEGTLSVIWGVWEGLTAEGALVHKVYPERRLALVGSVDGFEAVHYDSGERKPLHMADAPFHDLEAFGGYLAQVDEWGIVLTDGNGCLRLAPEPDGYYFCWGRFLSIDGGTAFFTLASNNANSKECRISRHMLSPGMFTSDGRGA